MDGKITIIYPEEAPYCRECRIWSTCKGVCGASNYFEGLKELIQEKKRLIEDDPNWKLGPPNYGSLKTLNELLESIASKEVE